MKLVRLRIAMHDSLETTELNKDEMNELNGCTITPEDLKKYPDAVKDVAHFSMNLKLQSRKTLDNFINEGMMWLISFKNSHSDETRRSSKSLF